MARGLRGVTFITSDDHAGLAAARKAVFASTMWQRCQFHLVQNAIHHAPTNPIRKVIGRQLRAVWNACDLAAAEAELARIVQGYAKSAPKLAEWLENTIPEGLAVFSLRCAPRQMPIGGECEPPTPSSAPSSSVNAVSNFPRSAEVKFPSYRNSGDRPVY